MSEIRRRWEPSFKVPNRLIMDFSLSFSARRMGAVLFSRRNHLGACRRSQASLAKLAGCSVTTARKALQELEDAGYITRSQNHRYNETLGRLVYDQYTYHCDLRFHGGFTLVPWNLFGHPLKSSAFVLCLYLYLQAGNKYRAFPSLNLICKDLGIGKATVCRALRELRDIGRIYSEFCIKMNHAYSRNSYYLIRNAVCCPDAVPAAQGGPRRDRPVLPYPLSCRAILRTHMMQRAGSVPFPCLNYRLKEGYNQVLLGLGCSFKTGKLVLDLDNVGLYKREKSDMRLLFSECARTGDKAPLRPFEGSCCKRSCRPRSDRMNGTALPSRPSGVPDTPFTGLIRRKNEKYTS